MNRKHALVIALALGVAAVAGTFALIQTVSLGARGEAATVSRAELAARRAKLDRAEAALRRAARQRPPVLPALPSRNRSAIVAFTSGSAAFPEASQGSEFGDDPGRDDEDHDQGDELDDKADRQDVGGDQSGNENEEDSDD